MRHTLGFLLLLVFVGGCITYGRDFPIYPVKSIETNVTTQKEVFSHFGEPVRKGLDSGYETWSYSYHYYEFGQLKDSKELNLVFNKDGTVRSYSFTAK